MSCLVRSTSPHLLKETCDKRGINEIPDARVNEYLKIVSYLRTKLSVPVAPAMSSVQSIFASNLEDKGQPEPKRCTHSQATLKLLTKGQLAVWFISAHALVLIPKPQHSICLGGLAE